MKRFYTQLIKNVITNSALSDKLDVPFVGT
mgnify:CR=1 FL=1|jgi:hypothetical protein